MGAPKVSRKTCIGIRVNPPNPMRMKYGGMVQSTLPNHPNEIAEGRNRARCSRSGDHGAELSRPGSGSPRRNAA
jgi:hypothetical protein